MSMHLKMLCKLQSLKKCNIILVLLADWKSFEHRALLIFININLYKVNPIHLYITTLPGIGSAT